MIFRQTRLLILLLSLIAAVSTAVAQPAITGMELTVPSPTNDPFLNWRIVFDQPVTGVSASNFTTSATGVAGVIQSVTPAPGNQTWTVRLSGISGVGTLGVDLSNPVGIMGTTAPLVETRIGPYYDVDTESPQVVSITRLDPNPSSSSTLNFAVTFSEPVFGVNASNFASGGSLTGTVQTPTTTDNVTWTVAMSGINGSGTVRLDLSDTFLIADAAGNSLLSDFIGGEVYDIDQNGPQLVCITRLDASPTSSSSVRFMVEFDEAAAGVTPANFTVSGTGTSGNIASALSEGDGTTWTVTVDGILGAGFLTIDLTSSAGITDIYGNASTSTGPGCESYEIDRVNPEVVSISLPSASPVASGTTATFVVTFSEAISTATLTDFQVVGTATGIVTSITLVSDTITVTVGNITGPGELCLRVTFPSTITDLVGNPLINIPVTSACYPVCLAHVPVTNVYPQNGETTVTTADLIHWTHPTPGLTYEVYFDGNFLVSTTETTATIPGPLTPGQHSYRIDIVGSCTSGTLVIFNVLDPTSQIFPGNGYVACLGPRVFNWDQVEGATTYTLYIDGFAYDATTVTQTDLGYNLPPGFYTWRVDVENEFGVQPGTTRSFSVTGFDAVLPTNIQTNGVVNKVLVTSSTVFVGGAFDAVLNEDNEWTTRSNLAAYNQFTGRLINWHPRVNGAVHAMDRHTNKLIFGGDFTKVGTTDTARIAVLEIDDWSTEPLKIRLGADNSVRAIEVVGDTLIYGGSFLKVGADAYNFGTFNQQISSPRLAISDITLKDGISAVSLSPNATVRDLLYDGGRLYIAGEFSQIGGRPIRALAQTTMPTTETLQLNPNFDAGISHYVYSIRKFGPTLFMGGSFTQVSGLERSNAAALRINPAKPLDPPTVTSWAPKVNAPVLSIGGTRNDSIIYLGGTFTSINLDRATYLAGVDPVVGYAATCEFNADRPVYSISVKPEGLVVPDQIFVGGQATLTGTLLP